MSDFNFTDITRTIVFFVDSLFIGLKFAVPVLFIIHLLSRKSNHRDLQICIRSANQLMILGGFLFIFTISANVMRAVSSDNEAERDMMIAFATGAHWYQFFFPIINYAILPLALWFRESRKTITVAMAIVSVWIITPFIIDYLMSLEGQNAVFSNKIDYHDYFLKLLVFSVTFTILYGWGKWKFNRKSYT